MCVLQFQVDCMYVLCCYEHTLSIPSISKIAWSEIHWTGPAIVANNNIKILCIAIQSYLHF